MPKYSIKVRGKTVIFKARNQREAISEAYSINRTYTNFKRLESRWWLLIFVLVFVVGYLFAFELGG